MLIRRPDDVPSRQITDERLFQDRRAFLAAVGGAALVAMPVETLLAASRKLARAAQDKLTPYEVGHHLQQLLRVRHRQVGSRRQLEGLPHQAVDGAGGGRGEEAGQRTPRRPREAASRRWSASTGTAASRAGRWWSPGWAIPLAELIDAARADIPGQVRRVHHAPRPEADAGAAVQHPAVAVRGGAADRRGDEPADAAGDRACTASRCRTRTERRSGWWCRGSTASRVASRS